MRLGIMQPYFFPYIGYFSLIKHVDKFILLDDVQFIRHGWIERNRILKQTDGWQYISVPLKKHARTTLIKDIEINNDIDWKNRLKAQLVHYKRAPYYKQVICLIEKILEQEYRSITDLNMVSLQEVMHYLDFDTPIEIFGQMGIEIEQVKAADEWALNICKAIPEANEYWNPPGGMSFFDISKYKNNGIELKFQEIEILEYKQKGDPFKGGLSIIDVMMFNNIQEINMMLDRYKIYE